MVIDGKLPFGNGFALRKGIGTGGGLSMPEALLIQVNSERDFKRGGKDD
jgi:hypothetical protein